MSPTADASLLRWSPAATPGRLRTDLRATATLDAATWHQVWELTNRYYETDRTLVEAKLRGHKWLALFHTAGEGRLIGVVAVDLYPADVDGRRVAVLFSSHAIIEEAWRGRNLLQGLGARLFLRARARYPLRPIYWLFDSFSYKSYLPLARNLREFWPRYDRPTPRAEQRLLTALARARYGNAFRADTGLVMRSPSKRLRPGTAPIEGAPAGDPHVRFFTRVNPGHAQGDMLVCLCPLNAANWRAIGRRALARMRRRAQTARAA